MTAEVIELRPRRYADMARIRADRRIYIRHLLGLLNAAILHHDTEKQQHYGLAILCAVEEEI